jgi:hypothetical protein
VLGFIDVMTCYHGTPRSNRPSGSGRLEPYWQSLGAIGVRPLPFQRFSARFTRLLELRAQDPGPFNYPIAVFSEWRGRAFYLYVRYRARSRRPEDDFVVRHTRMTLTGFGRFDLAYFRHTDKWFTV